MKAEGVDFSQTKASRWLMRGSPSLKLGKWGNNVSCRRARCRGTVPDVRLYKTEQVLCWWSSVVVCGRLWSSMVVYGRL